VGRSQGR
jgi:hypothetical protein